MAEENATIHTNVNFIGNWFFDKYDVELLLDDSSLIVLSYGDDYESKITTTIRTHF